MRVEERLWTAKGIERLGAECEALLAKMRAATLELSSNHNNIGGSCNESELTDQVGAHVECGMIERQLQTKSNLLIRLAPAPRPRGRNRAQVGHLIRILRDDESVLEFVLGGDGESCQSAHPQTVSCTAPLGKAVIGQKIGHEGVVEVAGSSYSFKIKNISLPTQATRKSVREGREGSVHC